MRPWRTSLLLALVVAAAPPARTESDEKYFGSIARLEQCQGSENYPVKVNKMFINYKGDNAYTITFDMMLVEDLSQPLDMRFEVEKCGSDSGPCEDYVNHTIDDLCMNLNDEGSIPHSLFKMAKLPVKCPIPKGRYAVEKNEIKIHPELLEVGKYGNYWKFKILLMKGPDTRVFCLYVEGKVAKMAKGRKKKRKGH